MCMLGTLAGKKRPLDPLELESLVTVSPQKDAGTESASSESEAQAKGSMSQEAGFESS